MARMFTREEAARAKPWRPPKVREEVVIPAGSYQTPDYSRYHPGIEDGQFTEVPPVRNVPAVVDSYQVTRGRDLRDYKPHSGHKLGSIIDVIV